MIRFTLLPVMMALVLPVAVRGQERDTAARSFTGRYRNVPFGYSFDIPYGRTCRGALPPAPAHGCFIELDSPDDRVDVSGDYFTLDGGDGGLIDRWIAAVRELDSSASVVSRGPVTVGGISGEKVVIVWHEKGQKRVQNILVAVRRSPGVVVPVEHTLLYSCRDVARSACEDAFKRIVKSFRVYRLR